MRKILMSFVALAAIAAAATGPVRAQSNSEELFYTLDGTQVGDGNAYNESSNITQGGISWWVTGNTRMNPWRIGGKSLNAVDRDIYGQGSLDETITKVSFDFGALVGITVNSITMFVASDANFSDIIEQKTVSYSANSAVDVTPGAGIEWTNAYYMFTFNVTVSGSSNKYFQLKSIKFYYDPNASGGGSTPEPEPEPAVPHTVRFAEGMSGWQVQDVTASASATAPAILQNVMAGDSLVVTAPASLNRKVKSVKAVRKYGMLEVPLTIEALTAGTIVVQQPQSGMQYTLNGGPKTAMTEAPTEITVAVGDKVAFYGNGTSITCYSGTTIGGTAEVKAYGNIMSLVNENGFVTATTLTANAAFSYLFGDYANLKDISGLLLPATTLTESCYATMFYNCTGLTTVPSDLLPATTMAKGCYAAMFAGCVNLTNVPTLPATTLAELCYNNMFLACNGLTTVPTGLLPATTLAESCYSYMFFYCNNLTTAPMLPATTLVDDCYSSMFASCYKLSSVTCLATSGINQNSSTEDWLEHAGSNVQGTKTFNAASSANWPMDNDNGIPSGWTRQNIDN